MSEYFITFRSVTLAQRGEGLLRKSGIPCTLQRTPRWMEAQGCGYCLRLRGQDVERGLRILRSGKIQFRKIYIQRQEGNVEEVEL